MEVRRMKENGEEATVMGERVVAPEAALFTDHYEETDRTREFW